MANGSSSSAGARGTIANTLGLRRLDAVWGSEIPERLVLEHFAAHERLSTPYIVQAEVLSPGGPVDFVPHLGKAAHVTLRAEDLPIRSFHGFLFSAEQVGEGEHEAVRYRLELRPWLYFLNQSSHWRIYQEKSVTQVIEDVLQEYGEPFRMDLGKLKDSYSAREYICQFGESDFHFLSRLMEEEGIYYYFSHTDDAHCLVACDELGSHGEAVGSYAFRPSQGANRSAVWRFDARAHRVVGSVQISDYDFTKAEHGAFRERIPVDTSNNTVPPTIVRDYPADILDPMRLAHLSLMRGEAHRAQRELFELECAHPEVGAGSVFNLVEHTDKRLNGKYLTVAADYDFTNPSPRSRARVVGSGLHLHLEAAPADGRAPWKPPRVTPKRIARGPQTAVVVGPEKEEIHTDPLGRVRVRFFWDQSMPPEDKKGQDSCWMRVSHGWAGPNMGEVFLPRVGHEVIVDFLDGDPERPIITGRFYNSANKSPVPSASNKTVSGWKTQTVYGKSTQAYDGAVDPPKDEPGFNELTFEDQSGQEEIYMRAQRDYRAAIYQDQKYDVHRDRSDTVGRNLSLEVKTGNETRKVTKGSRTTTINQKETLTVEKGDMVTKVSTGDQSTEVSQGNQSTNVKMGDQSTELGMGNQSIKIKMGNQDTKLDLGAASTEAMQKIELKVGESSIVIDQTGVQIKGLLIKIEASAMLSAKSTLTQVNGDGSLILKGGMTLIN